jgi:catechol 2,3-dioxygenase-like lactoylglutathione lyase family enzyme
MDLKLEVVVVPVSDVDRAKEFYEAAGFRMDIDQVGGDDFRVVQLTPPRTDVEEASAELVGRGVDVEEVFHDSGGGIIYHLDTDWQKSGPHTVRSDYGSFASFADPDSNGWVLQEVKTRAPGR